MAFHSDAELVGTVLPAPTALAERRRLAAVSVAFVTVVSLGLLSWAVLNGADPVVVGVPGLAALLASPVAIRRRLQGAPARAAVILWTMATLLGLGAAALVDPAMGSWFVVAIAGVAGVATFVFPGVLGTAVVVASGITVLIATWELGVAAALPMVAVAVLPGVFVRWEARIDEIGRQERSRHVELLLRRSRAADALHDIAVTMGASTTLDEVVPPLLRSITSGIDAGLGALLRIDWSNGTLALQSPVLVNGSVVDVAEAQPILLDSAGLLERAIRSPLPFLVDLQKQKTSRVPVLSELGVSCALLGPLHLEGRAVGLLVLAEPRTGRFEASDAEELSLLTGPTALVLGQIERHEQSAALARELEAVAEMKTDFVSMVSHELRTPLTSVMGALDTVSRPELMPDDPSVSSLLEGARRQSRRLKALIEDLLTLSRLDRAQSTPSLGVVPVGAVAEEAAGLVDADKVVVHSGSESLLAAGDRSQLAQVLTNLIENAVKHAGGQVDVVVGRVGDEVEVRVADHGPGIPEADRRRIFERFVRLDRSRDTAGTGLGLSIVQLLLESMGGAIGVEDTPGGGATFVVRLPFAGVVQEVA